MTLDEAREMIYIIPSMRYPAEHKQETHDRIVDAASRRFRRGGATVGIGQLMKTLKMTHGGFYRHFKSKDDLVTEALMRGFEDVRQRIGAAVAKAAPGQELQTIIATYLSEQHCADVAGGCPVAALGSEIARQPRAVRAAMSRAIEEVATRVGRFMAGATQEERRQQAGVLFSAMSGTLAVARAAPDEETRRAILEAARRIYVEAFAAQR